MSGEDDDGEAQEIANFYSNSHSHITSGEELVFSGTTSGSSGSSYENYNDTDDDNNSFSAGDRYAVAASSSTVSHSENELENTGLSRIRSGDNGVDASDFRMTAADTTGSVSVPSSKFSTSKMHRYIGHHQHNQEYQEDRRKPEGSSEEGDCEPCAPRLLAAGHHRLHRRDYVKTDEVEVAETSGGFAYSEGEETDGDEEYLSEGEETDGDEEYLSEGEEYKEDAEFYSNDGERKSVAYESIATPAPDTPKQKRKETSRSTPTLDPYVSKAERFELFSTAQCYYLVASDKAGTAFRVLKMDRTLIERPATSSDHGDGGGGGSAPNPPSNSDIHYNSQHHSLQQKSHQTPSSPTQKSIFSLNDVDLSPFVDGDPSNNSHHQQQQQHNQKPTFRRLSEFCTEDPIVYTTREIRDMLDMIHDGNQPRAHNNSSSNNNQNYNSATGYQHQYYHHSQHQHQSQNHPYSYDEYGNANAPSSPLSSNHKGGGLKPIVKAYGIVGFIRFLDCYYLTLITKRAKCGSIGGNGIYSIKSTETFPIKPAERPTSTTSLADSGASDPSSMLLSMWNRGKRSVGLGLTNREIGELRYQGLYHVVDLTKNFYFSYTYDITRSLQENFLAMTSQPFPPPPFKDMYAWNFFLTRELEECTSSLTSFHWVLPIIHGAFIQRKLNDYGRSLDLILLARRSRHFAGTRYLKRGVSDRGKVANDVEHEQIIHDETTSAASGSFSSFLQVRGSIPTYWTQESSVTMPKPPIVLNRVDPTYHATQAHFEDVLKRYSSPIVVVDLVKQSEKREREVIVGNEFRHAIDYLNCHMDDKHKIRYCALDYSHVSKHRNLNVSTSLNEVATWAVNQTGFFCSAPRWKILSDGRVEPFDESNTNEAAFLTHHLGVPVFPMEQKGVMRTNCIDCLDRTNVAQFSAGVDALAQALLVMGIRGSARLDPSSNIVRTLIDMYVEIGDHIALQYGGSEAHKKVQTAGSASTIQGPMGKHKELLTSIRRYYSNAFTDRLKQDAMNLFLGYYVPIRHTIPLWEMENDYYLHNCHVKAGRGSLQSMQLYQRTFAVDWSDDEEEEDSNFFSPVALKRRDLALSASHAGQSSLVNTKSGGKQTTKVAPNSSSEEPWRIERVRKRCKAQNEAMSVWWRVAIQSYTQQRMWMQLGRSPVESLLPPRFERLYQPDKLAQFDKIFARSWSTPMRLSHSAQHAPTADDDMELLLVNQKNSPHVYAAESLLIEGNEDQAAQANDPPSFDERTEDEDDSFTSLSEYIDLHGFKAETKPSLSRFLGSYDAYRANQSNHRRKGYSKHQSTLDVAAKQASRPSYVAPKPRYLSNVTKSDEPCEEYVRYTSPVEPNPFSKSYRKATRDELSRCLHETSLDSNDVENIRKLAESAQIGNEIRTGPYRGLSQHESAIEVTSIIHEQFNTLDNMRKRGELRGGGLPGVDDELKKKQVDTPGVIEAVFSGWDRFIDAEQAYAEILDSSSLGNRRSDLTNARSMQLYCSFFNESTPLSNLEMTYIHGANLPQDSKHERKNRKSPDEAPVKSTFAAKIAKRLGVSTTLSQAETSRGEPTSLFSYRNKKPLPPGFEQINDDLFARKDNRFMVFNGAGIESWKGPPQPVTKVQGIEEDIMVR